MPGFTSIEGYGADGAGQTSFNGALPSSRVRYRPIRFRSVGSTNDIALDAARAGVEPGLVIQADIQEAGKGRSTRDWRSPEGGLWASVILSSSVPQNAAALVPLAVGVACCRGLADLGAEVGLRWPNDLMLGDRKVGGILVESRSENGRLTDIVAGLGINVLNEPPIEDAASLKEVRSSLTPDRVRDAILGELGTVEDALEDGRPKRICAWFMEQAWGIGRELTLDGEPRIPREIAVDGALIVEDPEGNVEVHRSGSLRLP